MHNCCVGEVTPGPERPSGGTATGLDRSYRVGVVATVSYRAASQEVFGWNSRYSSPTHTGGFSYSADAFPEKAVVREDVGIGPGDLLCEKVVGAACDYCSCRRSTLLNGRATLRLVSRIGHSHALLCGRGPRRAHDGWTDRHGVPTANGVNHRLTAFANGTGSPGTSPRYTLIGAATRYCAGSSRSIRNRWRRGSTCFDVSCIVCSLFESAALFLGAGDHAFDEVSLQYEVREQDGHD